MDQLVDLLRSLRLDPVTLLDICATAVLIYLLFSLMRGTRAVRLVIGVTMLYGVYVSAQILGFKLLSQILQTGAVVGLFALVVVFQPELRRALERIGRVGSFGWLLTPGSQRRVERVARTLAGAAVRLSEQQLGALIVLERETGLEDTAEQGVMLHADLTPELVRTIFMRGSPLHDGAVVVRGEQIVAAGVVLPLSEVPVHRERYGTRHRAALGISAETDAVCIVVSEETGSVSLVERGRIIRGLDEDRLRNHLITLLTPGPERARTVRTAIQSGGQRRAAALGERRSGVRLRGGSAARRRREEADVRVERGPEPRQDGRAEGRSDPRPPERSADRREGRDDRDADGQDADRREGPEGRAGRAGREGREGRDAAGTEARPDALVPLPVGAGGSTSASGGAMPETR